MRTLDKKIFQYNPKKFHLLSELRRKGWGYTAIGLVFGVDHSSVYHQCIKHNIPKGKSKVNFSIKILLESLNIKAREAKSYSDYLRESGYKSVSQDIYKDKYI